MNGDTCKNEGILQWESQIVATSKIRSISFGKQWESQLVATSEIRSISFGHQRSSSKADSQVHLVVSENINFKRVSLNKVAPTLNKNATQDGTLKMARGDGGTPSWITGWNIFS